MSIFILSRVVSVYFLLFSILLNISSFFLLFSATQILTMGATATFENTSSCGGRQQYRAFRKLDNYFSKKENKNELNDGRERESERRRRSEKERERENSLESTSLFHLAK